MNLSQTRAAAETSSAHHLHSLSKGRPSREHRAGDCGGTSASQARANPHFRLYALRRALPFRISRVSEWAAAFGPNHPLGDEPRFGMGASGPQYARPHQIV
jgi:hypothetical protein